MPIEKARLDSLLVEKGFAANLSIAQSYILSGSVTVQGKKISKAGTLVPKESKIELSVQIAEDVSRGSLKLRGAIESLFGKDTKPWDGKFVCDLGASTGGFTQVALEKGAKSVLAVDVGYGQIAGRLRNNPNVFVLDRFHAKDLTWNEIHLLPHWQDEKDVSEIWFVTDLSFISLTSIFPIWNRLRESNSQITFHILHLVKPQFEVEKKHLSQGIVTETLPRLATLWKLARVIRRDYNGLVSGICNSPIEGQKGNKEYFLYWRMLGDR